MMYSDATADVGVSAAASIQGLALAHAGALIMQPRLLLLMFLIFLYVGTEFSIWSWTVTFFTPSAAPIRSVRQG